LCSGDENELSWELRANRRQVAFGDRFHANVVTIL
jgi:hypothetical protein